MNFSCRSFENNWNIYKLFGFQKPAQSEVSPTHVQTQRDS